MICKKCVMPESKPYITLNDEGVCNLCLNFTDDEPNKTLETDLVKILKKHKSKGKYDCLVMCSGGKDSTSSLYYMTQRYNLNPLAFTFDHGFETEGALENVKLAVEKLGVDFIYFRTDYMKKVFRKLIESDSKATICHLCSIWYMQLTYETAQRYQIPIIVAGWTKGQASEDQQRKCDPFNAEFLKMGNETRKFIKEHVISDPDYKNFPCSMEEVQKRFNKKNQSIVISPHWFLPYGPDTYVDTIRNELGWQSTGDSYPKNSTNCALNYLSVDYSMKHYGYTHYHVEMSKLIRKGLMSREEAMELLEVTVSQSRLTEISQKLRSNS